MKYLPGNGHAFSSLKWKQPAGTTASTTQSVLASMQQPDWNLSILMNAIGIVDFKAMGITKPRDKAITLLRAAAEVEHQFLIQYLYAYYCGGQDGANVSDPSLTETLLLIAKEEMGHLVTVQNLLAILGEPPYLERLKDISPDQEPSPFHLEPYCLPFVARFLVAESSPNATLPGDIGTFLAKDDLTVTKINRVGMLYAMLYWLFQNPAALSNAWTLPLGIDTSALQTLGHLDDQDFATVDTVIKRLNTAANWPPATSEPIEPPAGEDPGDILVAPPAPAPGDDTARIRALALRAIHFVAGQGEGATNQPDDSFEKSHSERLKDLYVDLQNKGEPKPIFPTDPYVKSPPDAPAVQPNQITNLNAVTLANEIDKQYEIILLFIALSVIPDTTDRGGPSSAAVDAMHALAGAAFQIVTLPRTADGDPELLAGPCFTFPESGIPLDQASIKQRLTDLGAM